ncbi:MAG TPA: hypothetical protein VGB44_08225 [Flavobacterium sp.]
MNITMIQHVDGLKKDAAAIRATKASSLQNQYIYDNTETLQDARK